MPLATSMYVDPIGDVLIPYPQSDALPPFVLLIKQLETLNVE